MKFKTVPVKRRPVKKGGMNRLSAVTRKRKKQRASAATATDADVDDGSSKISRALTIIFLIHIVAIGLIFIHQRFLDGRPDEGAGNGVVVKPEIRDHAPASTVRPVDGNAAVLSTGETPYFPKPGDNYAKIAAAHGVDEAELRALNGNVELTSGLILKVPAKRIVAAEPPEVLEIREQTPVDQDRGLVEAVDVTAAPRATVVRPSGGAAAPATGTSYVVKSGDSIWRISNRFNVTQDALMKANGITDPTKMKAGTTLVIPQ